MIYRKCCSSAYDRTRFAAVCSSWRVVASWHTKLPALPLLLPLTEDADARAYSLEDGRSLSVPLRGYPWGRIVGSHDGGWVAAVAASGARLRILNVFSGVQVPLSAKQSVIRSKRPRLASRVECEAHAPVTKIIFSEDPSSSQCILAAITNFSRCNIALCGTRCPNVRRADDDMMAHKHISSDHGHRILQQEPLRPCRL
jgi:hypothetical protein